MAEKKVFADGVRCFKKHEKAPSFVVGSIVITPKKLSEFMDKNPDYVKDYQGDKQITLQVTLGKDGGMIAAVDTWRPGVKQTDDLPF